MLVGYRTWALGDDGELDEVASGPPMRSVLLTWTVIGLAAIVRSYILLMGENTPDARRKTATTTRGVGFTLIVVGAIQMLVWIFTA
jgi:hypothetical protein